MSYEIIQRARQGVIRKISKVKPIDPPENESLTQKAYRAIRQMLFHKELVPGQKIQYRDLAKKLGMSPTPVIQALQWLEFQGLVHREQNRGTFVEPFSMDEVDEIYELRQQIELALLPISLKKMKDADIENLEKAYKAHLESETATYLNDRLLKDMEFHIALASISGWKVHLRTLQNLFDLLYLKYRGNYMSARPADIVHQEHQEIFKAVKARDADRAYQALSNHLTHVKEAVMENINKWEELADGRIDFRNGAVHLSGKPGLGFEPRAEMIERFRMDK